MSILSISNAGSVKIFTIGVAKIKSKIFKRSIAGQIEYWAKKETSQTADQKFG